MVATSMELAKESIDVVQNFWGHDRNGLAIKNRTQVIDLVKSTVTT